MIDMKDYVMMVVLSMINSWWGTEKWSERQRENTFILALESTEEAGEGNRREGDGSKEGESERMKQLIKARVNCCRQYLQINNKYKGSSQSVC